MQSFGKYIQNPQFKDVAGFDAKAKELPRVEGRPVFLTMNGKPQAIPYRQAIVKVGGNQDDVYAVVSSKYHIIQHDEALVPLREGIQSAGLQFRGSFYQHQTVTSDGETVEGTNGARVNGLLIFEDPTYKFELLAKHKEPFMLGLRFGNSVDGSARMTLSDFGVNMVCTNFNMWGKLNERISLKHVRSGVEGVKDVEAYIEGMLQRAAAIPGIVAQAASISVEPTQVSTILLGIEMPQRVASELAWNFNNFLVGPQKKQGVTLKTVYDVATNYWTNHYPGSLGRAEWGLNQAQELMTLDVDKFIARGEQRLAEAEERKADKKAKPKAVAVKAAK